MDDIYRKLTEIMRNELGIDDLELQPDTVLDDLPGWDSVTLAGVLLAVEDQFHVNAVRRDAGILVTGADLARLCQPA